MCVRSTSHTSDESRRAQEAARQREAQRAREAAQAAQARQAAQEAAAHAARAARDASTQHAARGVFANSAATSIAQRMQHAPTSTSTNANANANANANTNTRAPAAASSCTSTPRRGLAGLATSAAGATGAATAHAAHEDTGVFDKVGHFLSDRVDDVRDVAGTARDVTRKLADAAVDGASSLGSSALDVGRTEARALGAAARAFASHGLDVVGGMHDASRTAIDQSLDVSGNIGRLRPRDTFTLAAGASASAGIGANVSTGVVVTRMDDGRFSVAADGKGGLNLGLGDHLGGTAGIEGRTTYVFDTPKDATRAALALAAQESTVATAPIPVVGIVHQFASALTPEDTEMLRRHIGSIEMRATGGIGAGNAIKLGGDGVGLKASGELESGYRIDFHDGKPESLVRVTEVGVKGAGGLGTLTGEIMQRAFPDASSLEHINNFHDMNAKLVVETRVPWKADYASAIAQLVSDPARITLDGGVSSMTASVEARHGEAGYRGELRVDVLTPQSVDAIVERARTGDFANLFVDASPVRRGWRFTESGPDANVDVIVGNVNAGAVLRRLERVA